MKMSLISKHQKAKKSIKKGLILRWIKCEWLYSMSLKLDFFYLYFSDQHKSPDFFQCVDICLPEVSFQSKSQKRINRKFHLKYTAWTKQNVSEVSCLGEGPATKSDEFLGKFQTALDLPPLWSFSENSSDLVVWPVPYEGNFLYEYIIFCQIARLDFMFSALCVRDPPCSFQPEV